MATSAGPSFFAFLMLCICVSLAKNVDTRFKRQSDLEQKSCDSVTPFFQSKNITVSAFNDKKGRILFISPYQQTLNKHLLIISLICMYVYVSLIDGNNKIASC